MTPHSEELSLVAGEVLRDRKQKTDQLFSSLYSDLRKLALRQMRREPAAHSWHPTLLVNELYLELLKNKAFDNSQPGEETRQEFLALSGFLMKRLLILHSRPLRHRAVQVGQEWLSVLPADDRDPGSLAFVEEILSRIEQIDPRLRTVVEMKVFQGESTDEIAARLGCSVRTVGSLWSFSRRWLESELDSAR